MNAPYLLIPIILVLLILYIISLLFSYLDVISKAAHRKIWNFGLLGTFLTTAILGTLMAIQINYKLEVPWTEKILKWHVNFGIGMAITGLFHFLWHWRYYLSSKKAGSKLREEKKLASTSEIPVRGPYQALFQMFLIGFTGILFQTFLMRELLGLFQGNELMMSIILFLWLLITGSGAFAGTRSRIPIAGKFSGNKDRSNLLILSLIILPLLIGPLMYYGKSLFFAPGIEAGPLAFSLFLLLLLTPFCFLNGFSFSYIARLKESTGITIRKAYVWESLGGAVAGITCTVAILLGIFTLPASRIIEKLFHPNEEILSTVAGTTGRITITRTGDQVNVYENGILAHSSGNTLVCEEMAHFGMTRHSDPKKVLVIGGILSGITEELVKYECERIDLAEPDPGIFKLAEELNLIPKEAPPIAYIRKSIPVWLKKQSIKYDVVLIMLPGPQTLSLNRFYTSEYFKFLKKHLSAKGIISVKLPGSANYLSEDGIHTIGPVYNALQESFSQTMLFPGENNYLIGGNSIFGVSVLPELESRGITATYLSTGYFNESQFQAKILEMNDIIRAETRVNTNLQPTAFFGQIAWWLGQFPSILLWPIAAIILIIVLFSLISGHTAYSSMFIFGAGAAGSEVILLLLMQISAGSLYLFTGIVLALFMIGLSFGSSTLLSNWVGKIFSRKLFLLPAFILITAGLGVLALWMTKTSYFIGIKTSLIILFTLLISTLTGLFFSHLTTTLPDQKSGGKLYVYDLLGAAVGALVYPIVIIPIFGLLNGIGIISASGVLILMMQIRKN
jgi:spermidine synthase